MYLLLNRWTSQLQTLQVHRSHGVKELGNRATFHVTLTLVYIIIPVSSTSCYLCTCKVGTSGGLYKKT